MIVALWSHVSILADSDLIWTVVPYFIELLEICGESLDEFALLGLALGARGVQTLALLANEAMHVHGACFALAEEIVQYAVLQLVAVRPVFLVVFEY